MRICKTIGLSAAVFLLLGSVLTGCSQVTAEDLMRDAQNNLNNAKSVDGDFAMEMNMGIDEGALSMGIGINADMDMEVLNDPEMYHMNGTIGIDLMDMTLDMEIYGREADDKMETYVNAGEGWQKSVVEEDAAGGESVIALGDSLLDASNCELQRDTESVNGQEAYVISARLEGDDFVEVWDELQDAFSAAGGLTDDISVELSGLRADVTYHIYKDTKLPAGISLVVEGGEDAVLTEVEGIGILLRELSFAINFDEYNQVNEIEIPAEALQAPEEETGADGFAL